MPQDRPYPNPWKSLGSSREVGNLNNIRSLRMNSGDNVDLEWAIISIYPAHCGLCRSLGRCAPHSLGLYKKAEGYLNVSL